MDANAQTSKTASCKFNVNVQISPYLDSSNGPRSAMPVVEILFAYRAILRSSWPTCSIDRSPLTTTSHRASHAHALAALSLQNFRSHRAVLEGVTSRVFAHVPLGVSRIAPLHAHSIPSPNALRRCSTSNQQSLSKPIELDRHPRISAATLEGSLSGFAPMHHTTCIQPYISSVHHPFSHSLYFSLSLSLSLHLLLRKLYVQVIKHVSNPPCASFIDSLLVPTSIHDPVDHPLRLFLPSPSSSLLLTACADPPFQLTCLYILPPLYRSQRRFVYSKRFHCPPSKCPLPTTRTIDILTTSPQFRVHSSPSLDVLSHITHAQ
ncbi:hypothetical protein BDN70DRAFT_248643 [Pholiota conissans]|uniref:Uncharacterized protein n=1 Tax=Pholiota conissans TaxID=109636 RepID=A0A9P5YVK1_9AGAR|nr:hypothetical protein BDN70DRAFT_248643 [Pholiota conissans]